MTAADPTGPRARRTIETGPADHAWTAPGAHAVTDDIYRIPLAMPNDGLRAVNVYAVVCGAELLLVDGGWATADAEEALAEALSEIGRGLSDIATIVVTHAHRDHYTLAVQLRARYGARIEIGRGEQSAITAMMDGWGRSLRSQGPRMVAADAVDLLNRLADPKISRSPHAYVAESFEPPDRWLDDGDLIRCGTTVLEAKHTPGHTDGHMVFLDRAARVLFSGDHILPKITPSVGFEPALTDDPLGAYLRSLRFVADGPELLLLPAHGPVAESAPTRARELLAHHTNRLALVAATCAEGLDTARAVAESFTWTRHERELHELDLFNQTLAVIETLLHLDHLALRGDLSRATAPDGTRRFRPC